MRNQQTRTNQVERATNDDLRAKAELFRTYSPQLYRKAYPVLRNHEDAEDALQNCWSSVITSLHSFEGRSSLSTSLTRILVSSALMMLSKKRKEKALYRDTLGSDFEMDLLLQLESDCMNPEQALLQSERKMAVEQAMLRLRPRIRAAPDLAQRKELSMNETTRALGIPLPAAKARVFHAREALRRSPVLRAVIQQ